MTDEEIIKAAVAAMPYTNPLVAEDLQAGFTMHTEKEDILAIWQAAIKAEREACANLADQHEYGPGGAAAIRARGA